MAAASSVTSPLCTWLGVACMSVTCGGDQSTCPSMLGSSSYMHSNKRLFGSKWGRRKRVFLSKCSSELQSQRDLISSLWILLSGPHDFLPRFRALLSVLCLQRFLFLSLRIQQCSCSFKSETHPFQSSRPFRYYVAPSGKKLCSMVEVQKYFLEHLEHMTDGVTLSQFSFQIPRPLQENYVRKRPTCRAALCDGTRPLEPDEVSPLSWVGPDDGPDLQLNRSTMPSPYFEAPVFEPVHRPAKK